MRRNWAALAGLFAVAAAAITLSAYSGASSPEGNQPQQPINFSHPTHVKTLGMNCLYCHYAANKSPDPGLPAVATCMGCHVVVGNQLPEVKKLAQYANSNTPIPWERIHKLPEYVRFPHVRHVSAGVTCQTCHGQVQDMAQVYQENSLNMGWCVNCHLENKARYDCAVCHY